MKKLLICSLLFSMIFILSCGDDDSAPVVFDQPTIAVVVDNSQPFQGDEITFTITVRAEGGLSEVFLNGTSIKTYTDETTEDTFDYPLTIGTDATTGPIGYQFTVEDNQTEVLNNLFDVSVTIQNSNLRGTPVILTDFQDEFSASTTVASTEWSGYQDSWGFVNSFEVIHPAEDPTNPANITVRMKRRFECCFTGFNTAYLVLNDPIPEEEIAGIISGDRVLQMNIYYEEIDSEDVLVHNNPEDHTNPDNQFTLDFSYTLLDHGSGGWNYETQDTVQTAIPIQIDLGNRETWAEFPVGRGLQLFGTITEANTWQTVTFTVAYNSSGDAEDFELRPKQIADGNEGFIIDSDNVDNSNIDYIGLIPNAGHISTPNEDGWFEMPSDGNQNSTNSVKSFQDQDNRYYIDNIRFIDADVFDQNPNQ